MLTLGGSTFMVGLDAFALSGPGWLLTLWGGWLADRFDRKYIVIFFQALQMIAVFVIIVLMYLEILHPWMLIVASLISGITDSLSMPALQTIVPSLVSKEEVPRAISLNSMEFNISRMIGPAIAGIVMARYGAIACFSGNLVSYFPLFFSVMMISPRGKKSNPIQTLEQTWVPCLKDFASIVSHQTHFRLLLSVLINGILVVPMVVFVPVLIKQVLHGSVEHLGLVMGAWGIGGLAGAVGGVSIMKVITQPRLFLLFPMLAGLIVVGLALNQNIIVLGLGLMTLGACTGVLVVTTNSRIQVESDNHQRGRSASFFQLAMQGGIALGGLWTGTLSQAIGIQEALVVNGCACAILQMAIFLVSKESIRKHS